MTCNFGKSSSVPQSGIIFALTVLCVLCTVLPSHAQEFGRIEQTESNVAYFYFAEKGEATIQVLVWGTVSRPGIYEVGTDTQIDRLLTMAGGAPIPVEQEDRDPAEITISLHRPDGNGNKAKVFEARIQELLAPETAYPPLNDNDILVVETYQPGRDFGWRDALSLISSVGTLTLIGLRLFGARR